MVILEVIYIIILIVLVSYLKLTNIKLIVVKKKSIFTLPFLQFEGQVLC